MLTILLNYWGVLQELAMVGVDGHQLMPALYGLIPMAPGSTWTVPIPNLIYALKKNYVHYQDIVTLSSCQVMQALIRSIQIFH